MSATAARIRQVMPAVVDSATDFSCTICSLA
jgi:hypothetical protein